MEPKSVVFSELARIGKALASPVRLELLDWLCQRDFSVEELAEAANSNTAAISHHLQILKNARLVDVRASGTWRFYTIRTGIPALWRAMMEAGDENLVEIRSAMADFMKDPESFTAMSSRELKRRVVAGEALIIDVRPSDEFEAGHFPGAVSIPMEELEAKIRNLPRECEIIAYCRGPYCLMSHTAVELLKKRGIKAKRWTAGTADWISEGVALEVGAGPLLLDSKTRRVPGRSSRTTTKR